MSLESLRVLMPRSLGATTDVLSSQHPLVFFLLTNRVGSSSKVIKLTRRGLDGLGRSKGLRQFAVFVREYSKGFQSPAQQCCD